jgi:hypothetical protein
LDVGTVNATTRVDALEGTAQLTARRASEVKQLKISFLAGTKIRGARARVVVLHEVIRIVVQTNDLPF